MVGDTRTDEIIHNVRELNKLDPTCVFTIDACTCAEGIARMFLSRTVAAEVCMEAKTNESAYTALKKLDQQGELLFDLSCVVSSLTFLR
jgi:2-C-methyl-D-erythritol 4-phosphate cytidylyltransferase